MRDDHRGINELIFARFDAKSHERPAEQDARIETSVGEIHAEFVEFQPMLDRRFSEQREIIERWHKGRMRWMFVAWASLLIPIIGFGLSR